MTSEKAWDVPPAIEGLMFHSFIKTLSRSSDRANNNIEALLAFYFKRFFYYIIRIVILHTPNHHYMPRRRSRYFIWGHNKPNPKKQINFIFFHKVRCYTCGLHAHGLLNPSIQNSSAGFLFCCLRCFVLRTQDGYLGLADVIGCTSLQINRCTTSGQRF